MLTQLLNDKVRRPGHKVKVPESADELDSSHDSSSSSDLKEIHLFSDWGSIVQCDDL